MLTQKTQNNTKQQTTKKEKQKTQTNSKTLAPSAKQERGKYHGQSTEAFPMVQVGSCIFKIKRKQVSQPRAACTTAINISSFVTRTLPFKTINDSAITFKLAQTDTKLFYFASKSCTWQISTVLLGALWEWPHQVLPPCRYCPQILLHDKAHLFFLDSQKLL